MNRIKVTKQYLECGHSYDWSMEDLQDPDKHPEECPLCRVVLLDPQEDYVIGD